MFPFNLLLDAVSKKSKVKHFEPLESNVENYRPPSPGEIKQMLRNMSRCSHCHFLIFDNYFSGEVEKINSKLCPTCGWKS